MDRQISICQFHLFLSLSFITTLIFQAQWILYAKFYISEEFISQIIHGDIFFFFKFSVFLFILLLEVFIGETWRKIISPFRIIQLLCGTFISNLFLIKFSFCYWNDIFANDLYLLESFRKMNRRMYHRISGQESVF